jgi:hypothetical protein
MSAIIVGVFVLLTPLSYIDDALAAAKEDIGLTGGTSSSSSCIRYDSVDKQITIDCNSSIRLSDVDKQLNNTAVLQKENGSSSGSAASAKVWSLNAGIVIEKGSTLIIDSRAPNG